MESNRYVFNVHEKSIAFYRTILNPWRVSNLGSRNSISDCKDHKKHKIANQLKDLTKQKKRESLIIPHPITKWGHSPTFLEQL